MKKLKHLIFTLIASLGLVAPVAVPAVVGAQAPTDPNITQGLECGANFQATSTGCEPASNPSDDITNLIGRVINIFSLVVGIVAVIMIIIGGVKYITSGGDSGNVTGAKNTILYAVIGLVIVAIAQIIVNFVLQQSTDL